MGNWRLTNMAVSDLDSIWKYTYEKWSERQADEYYFGLIEEIGRIAERNPIIDREYSEIKSGIFGHHFRKHLIFYRKMQNNNILVIRVLHEKMDIQSKFA
ncbi:MAG: type II toxin-antitoxin system RelE/ParE family toxin [Paludibacteraceae bacterium]|nr:type II toxin-antitoxin system RelE/ParE family toxin [Paludibacteraceae bacterium]MBP5481686.1 type II toxin-antitoxin system RelE/ParE family toxin [Paludibacteraceae bacterium]